MGRGRAVRLAPWGAVISLPLGAVVSATLIDDETVGDVVFTVGAVVSELLLFWWFVARGGRKPLCTRDHVHGASRTFCTANHGTEWRPAVALFVFSVGIVVAMALAGEPLGALAMLWLPLVWLAFLLMYRPPPRELRVPR